MKTSESQGVVSFWELFVGRARCNKSRNVAPLYESVLTTLY